MRYQKQLSAALHAVLLAFATLGPGTLLAEPCGNRLPLQSADIFSLAFARDVQISSDARWVAYIEERPDIASDRTHSTLHVIDRRSNADTIPFADGEISAPSWSPDARRLAFVRELKGKIQLRVLMISTGAFVDFEMPNAPDSVRWSPDGTRLAYIGTAPGQPVVDMEKLLPRKPAKADWAPDILVSDAVTPMRDSSGWIKPGNRQLWLLDLAPGAVPTQLTNGPFDYAAIAWMPDGRGIVASTSQRTDKDLLPQESDLFLVDIRSGTERRLTDQNGAETDPSVSPDGRYIAYTGSLERRRSFEDNRLFLLDMKTGVIAQLLQGLDRAVDQPIWAADSHSIYFRYIDGGSALVGNVSLSGAYKRVASGLGGDLGDRPYVAGSYSVARDGTLAFAGASATRPLEVIVAKGSKSKRLSDLNGGLLAERCLATITPLAVRSSVDGAWIDAWLMMPPQAPADKPVPLILEIHGGPYSTYGPVWSSQFQLFASAGYAVVFANPRGSDGYGQAFADMIDKDFPGRSAEDLTSAVDAAIARGGIDASRVYVTGGSGGGLLTAWLVGTTDRFRAAVSIKPVIDWTSEVMTTDVSVMMLDNWFRQPPWENLEEYWRRSPLSLVGRVKTPTMMIVGAEDQRTPPGQAIEFYKALKYRGVPARLALVPEAGHETIMARPSHLLGVTSLIIDWFDRYGGRP